MTASVSAPRRAGIAVGLALVALAIASLFIGVGQLEPGQLLSDPEAMRLMLASRVPRTLAALLAGSGLAIAGLIMQTLARNEFVEPSTVGTAPAAMLGIMASILIWPAAPLAAKFMMGAATALVATALFLSLARRLPATQPFLVPLFGLVYGGVIGSVVTFVAWRVDMLQTVEVWMTADFSGVLRGRYELLWLAGAVVVLSWWIADRLTILSLGEASTTSLGLNHGRLMQLGLLMVSVVSAITVVVVGVVPFVGLVVPNIVARLVGGNLRRTIPIVAGAGGVLVLACDMIGRLVRFPYEVPVGVVVGVVGAAAFLVLIFRRPAHA